MPRTIHQHLAVWTIGTLALLVQSAAALDAGQATLEPVVLEVGARAPEFTSTDELGRTWKLSDHLGKHLLVICFYPGDFTGGCTRQAEALRDHTSKLADKGVKIIGASGDLPATHQLFKQSHQLNYTLLSDSAGSLARQFGVPVSAGCKVRARDVQDQPIWDSDRRSIILSRPVTLARWTFVVDREGRIIFRNANVNPSQAGEELVRFLETYQPLSK